MSSPAAKEAFPITAAQLSGNICETLFFGMYLVTFCFCIRTLFLTGSGREERWVRLHEVRWLMTGVSLSLFVICTFDVALGLLHNFHAFIESKDAEKELDNIADWINIARVRMPVYLTLYYIF
jgi:NADH:ubiquinone oxidoreductase subunit 5 (subunit L)/multisubunit Na+/H+ antiporter MnhA subunit